MRLILLSFFDSAAECYTRPFFAGSRGEAVRLFSDLVADPDHAIGRHPEDYTLYVLGSFNQQTGELERTEPVSLGNGMDFRARDRVARLEA